MPIGIANDPAFQRTRENGSEIGRAGKGGKLIRVALRNLMQKASDKRVTSRLTQKMMEVIKSDVINERGDRSPASGNLLLMSGFEFNINGKLSSLLFVDYTPVIDRVAGTAVVDFGAFVALNNIAAPAGTTHFRLSVGGVELDFDNESHVFGSESTAILI